MLTKVFAVKRNSKTGKATREYIGTVREQGSRTISKAVYTKLIKKAGSLLTCTDSESLSLETEDGKRIELSEGALFAVVVY